MKITSVDAFLVPPQWQFIRIQTDEGVTGWGEAGAQFRARAVQAAIHDARGWLVGRDPLPVEAHWQVLRRSSCYRGGPVLSSALSGIDLALWDIKGKAMGAPVHELLGGPVRERVRSYVWVGGNDLCEFDPSALIDEAQRYADQGFSAFKLTAGRASAIEPPEVCHAIVSRLEALRHALGNSIDIAVDAHGRWSKPMARRMLPALGDLDLLFLEEPMLAEDRTSIGELTAATHIPIALGERLLSRWEFAEVLEQGVAVVQPDVAQASGISETRRIAAMAEMHDVTVAPHAPLGPLMLAASLQIDFAVPNILVQEQGITHFGEWFAKYVQNPEVFRLDDGWFSRPTGPGLGVDVDEAAVLDLAEVAHDRKQPIWFHPDGSYAEY
ncbi:MAG: galactonate dehydratase [Gaiellales bacterium]